MRVTADAGASGVHDAIQAASGPCAAVQRRACVRSASRSLQHVLRRVVARARVERLRLPRRQASQSRSRRGLSAGGSERRTSRPSNVAAARGSGASTSSAGSASRSWAAGHTCDSDAKVPRGSCTAIQGNCRQAIGLASAPPHACRPQPHGPAVWNTQRPAAAAEHRSRARRQARAIDQPDAVARPQIAGVDGRREPRVQRVLDRDLPVARAADAAVAAGVAGVRDQSEGEAAGVRARLRGRHASRPRPRRRTSRGTGPCGPAADRSATAASAPSSRRPAACAPRRRRRPAATARRTAQHRQVDFAVAAVDGRIDQHRLAAAVGDDVAAPQIAVQPRRRLGRAGELGQPGGEPIGERGP